MNGVAEIYKTLHLKGVDTYSVDKVTREKYTKEDINLNPE